MLGTQYPLLDIFWTMLEFFLFFIWIFLIITIFMDIFRSHDMKGFTKFVWVLFIIILPLLGALVYLIARGGSMHERSAQQARELRLRREGVRRLGRGERHPQRAPGRQLGHGGEHLDVLARDLAGHDGLLRSTRDDGVRYRAVAPARWPEWPRRSEVRSESGAVPQW